MKEFKELCNELSGLTEINNTTESLIVAAEYFGLSKAVQILKHIKSIHKIEGYMPFNLKEYRYDVYIQILEHAEYNLSDVDYKKFYQSL